MGACRHKHRHSGDEPVHYGAVQVFGLKGRPDDPHLDQPYVPASRQSGFPPMAKTPCGSQAYPYLLLLQVVIHVLRLKVDGDDQRCQEPRVCKISSRVAQPFRFSS
jgi:hypothetical protein